MYLYSKLQPLSFIPLGFCGLVLEISHNLSIRVVFPDVMLPVDHAYKINLSHVKNVLPKTNTVFENDGPALAEVAATSFKIVDLVK